MNIIVLLDCAFLFFQNYPCRLSHTELRCELPCEDIIFNSKHPFADPDFQFTRNTTILEGFQILFQYGLNQSQSSPYTSPFSPRETNKLGLTMFDMFLLIHRKYQCL
jgi:hypothetical protein